MISNTVKTLCNIHNEGVIHNDIKPENILVERHGNMCEVRIIDFALSEKSENIGRVRKEMVYLERILEIY